MTTGLLDGAQCALLDIDGTLVDSNEFHVTSWQEALHRSGHDLEKDVIRQQIGKGADQLIPALLPHATDAERQTIAGAHDEVFVSQYLGQVRAFPDANAFVARLHARGIKVVLASSAKRAELDHYVGLLQIDDLIEASTCSDDVEKSKPAGDLFAAALQKISTVPADRALAVGDTPYDVIAAAKCGIATIAVLSGGFSESSLRAAGARGVYADVSELLRLIAE
jgi:HAD superfamily hydrolase (TIGR01509 family)